MALNPRLSTQGGMGPVPNARVWAGVGQGPQTRCKHMRVRKGGSETACGAGQESCVGPGPDPGM